MLVTILFTLLAGLGVVTILLVAIIFTLWYMENKHGR